MIDDSVPTSSELTPHRSSSSLSAAEHGNGEWNGAAAVPSATAGPNITIYLHAVRRHWLKISAIGLLCAAVAGPAVWLAVEPQYTAEAYIRISLIEERVIGDSRSSAPDRDRFEIFKSSQQQMLLSRFVLTAALRKPEVERIDAIREERRRGGDDVEWLLDRLGVYFPGKAEVMKVTVTRNSAEEAVTLVNAVVSAYMTEVANAERDQKRGRLSELERVCAAKEQDLRNKRQDLKTLPEVGSNAQMLTVKQQLVLEELAARRNGQFQLVAEIRKLQGEMAAQRATLENVDKMDIPEAEMEALVQADPEARKLWDDLGWKRMGQTYMAQAARKEAKNGYIDHYSSQVAALEKRYEDRREILKQKARERRRTMIQSEIVRCQAEIANRQGQIEAIGKEVEAIRGAAEKFGQMTVEVEMLQTDIKNSASLLAELTSERERLRVELQSTPRISTPWGPAQKPLMASNSRARLILTLLVVVVGFCVPGAVVVFLDTRSNRINTPDDVSKGLHVPLIGSVPRIPARVIRKLESPSKRCQAWHLRLTESVDGIAARLLRKADVDQQHVIMVSSAVGGEGKTTLATQLALSFARTGRRTVLVDFDLRRPSLDGMFGAPLTPGVSDLLRHQSAAADLVQSTTTEHLSIVTAGQWDRQALASLANGGAAAMFQRLREEFDFVVVDTSPLLPVADARFISQLADTVVLAVLRDVSEAPKIQAACEILAAFGASSVEAVLTGLNENLSNDRMGYASSATA